MAHFNKPLHINIRQDFEKLRPNKFNYDGVVIDDLPLYKWDAEELIALTDRSCDTSINVKYGTGVVPKGMKVIICGNSVGDILNKHWSTRRIEAIKRRCRFYMFDETPLYFGDNVDTRQCEIIYYNQCNQISIQNEFNPADFN